jgi:hypothetical protein
MLATDCPSPPHALPPPLPVPSSVALPPVPALIHLHTPPARTPSQQKHEHTYIHSCLHSCTPALMHTRTYTLSHAHTLTHTHTLPRTRHCLHTHSRMHIHPVTHAHALAIVCTHTHACTYTLSHTHTHSPLFAHTLTHCPVHPVTHAHALAIVCTHSHTARCTQVCPRVSFTGTVLDIRSLFHIRYDDELERCGPLRDALWAVIDSWDNLSKRKFLKFVTGVDTLPAPGMESLRIEVPFLCFTPSDYLKAVATLPQSHVRGWLVGHGCWWVAGCGLAVGWADE